MKQQLYHESTLVQANGKAIEFTVTSISRSSGLSKARISSDNTISYLNLTLLLNDLLILDQIIDDIPNVCTESNLYVDCKTILQLSILLVSIATLFGDH